MQNCLIFDKPCAIIRIMSKRSIRVLAIVALVFMALFVASLTAWSFDRGLFNGAIGYVAIFTGGIGIGIYVVLLLLRRAEKRNAQFYEDTETPSQSQSDAEKDQPSDASQNEPPREN